MRIVMTRRGESKTAEVVSAFRGTIARGKSALLMVASDTERTRLCDTFTLTTDEMACVVLPQQYFSVTQSTVLFVDDLSVILRDLMGVVPTLVTVATDDASA